MMTIEESLTWFFDDPEDWPYILNYQESGITRVEIKPSAGFTERHVYFYTDRNRMYSAIRYKRLANLYNQADVLILEVVELETGTHRLYGEPLIMSVAEFFSFLKAQQKWNGTSPFLPP